MSNKLLLCTCFLWYTTLLFSQNRFDSWGVVSADDLAMTSWPDAPEANAVILHNVGTTWIQDGDSKWYVTHTRFLRIKIFDVASFDQSNLNIRIRAGRSGEQLRNLRVQHILPNGVVQPVTSGNLFREKQNRYYDKMKIFVPNLQNGSVVEYQYELQSDYIFNLYDWYFHQDLPVRWSEITTNIRPEFEYQFIAQSRKKFDENSTKTTMDGGVSLRVGLSNLAAMREEPYMTTIDDHRASISFQLRSYQPPSSHRQMFMESWAKTAKDMHSRTDFGRQYEKTSNFKNLWDAFEQQVPRRDTAPEKAAQQVLDFVGSAMRWNNEFQILTEKSIDDAFKRKNASSAELNLAVVALLKKAGWDAVPVLVSTRHHGKTQEKYPFIQQFNSVLALLRRGQQQWLLDATSPFLPPGQLHLEHCSQRGWVADHKSDAWIDIPAPESNIMWLGEVQLDAEGQMEGHFTMSGTGPMAAFMREKLAAAEPEQAVKGIFATGYSNATFDSVMVQNADSLHKPVVLDFNCEIPNTANVTDQFIYCRPIVDFFASENPFKSLKREFPVNFAYPIKANYIINIHLPKGYKVEELPKGERVNLPTQTGYLTYNTSQVSDTQIQVLLKMVLVKSEYDPSYYDALRNFFDRLENRFNAQIALKKF
jgi:hypothetical protein